MKSLLDFFSGFKTTLWSGPFLKLCITDLLVFNGFMLVASFQFYMIIYYVMGSNEVAGVKWAGIAGTVGAVANFVIVAGMAWLGTKIGKRRVLMIANVVEVDELETHKRREGIYGSIFWWMVKLDVSAALAMSGYLLNATGFDVSLGPDQTGRTLLLMRIADIGVPVVTSAIAFWAIATFPVTEDVARNVRQQLEARRGKA